MPGAKLAVKPANGVHGGEGFGELASEHQGVGDWQRMQCRCAGGDEVSEANAFEIRENEEWFWRTEIAGQHRVQVRMT